MATIGITIAAISPVDSFLLELPFEEPVEVEAVVGPGEFEDDGPSAGCVTPTFGVDLVVPPAVEVGLLAFPPPAVVEISASIVPAEFPHPREISVRESPRLLDRAYVTHAGASEELKRSLSFSPTGDLSLEIWKDSPSQDRSVDLLTNLIIQTRA